MNELFELTYKLDTSVQYHAVATGRDAMNLKLGEAF